MEKIRIILWASILLIASGQVGASIIQFIPNQSDLAESFGTFVAPETGGYVSDFSATIQGITFDMPALSTDNNAPTFDIINNSIGSPLGLDGNPLDPNVPGLIYHGGVFDGIILNLFHDNTYNLNFVNSGLALGYDDTGTYSIGVSPVPAPPAVWLFLTGLIGLGIAHKKTRQGEP